MSLLQHQMSILVKRVGEYQTVADGSSTGDIRDCKDLLASIEALEQAAFRAKNELKFHVSHLESMKRLNPSGKCPF